MIILNSRILDDRFDDFDGLYNISFDIKYFLYDRYFRIIEKVLSVMMMRLL